MGRREDEEMLVSKEKYVDGCPGCEVDRHKQMQTGLPLNQLLIVLIIVLSTGNHVHV